MSKPEAPPAINPAALRSFDAMVRLEMSNLGFPQAAIDQKLETLTALEPTNPEYLDHWIDARWITYRDGFLAGETAALQATTKSGLQSIRVETFRIRNKFDPKKFKKAGWTNFKTPNSWFGWSNVGKVWARRSIGGHLAEFKRRNKAFEWSPVPPLVDPSLPDDATVYWLPDNYELVDAQTGEIVDWSVILPKGAIVRFRENYHRA